MRNAESQARTGLANIQQEKYGLHGGRSDLWDQSALKPQGPSEAAPQTGRDMRILNAAIIGGGMIEDYYAQCERELQPVPNLNDASLFVTW